MLPSSWRFVMDITVQQFLVLDACAVFLIALLDWLLGEKKRGEIKDLVASWWLNVEQTTWSGFARKDAKKILSWLQKIFGMKWNSKRRIFMSAIVSFLLYICFVLVLSPDMEGPTDQVQRTKNAMYFIALVGVPGNALFDWISLSTTMHFFRMMAKSTTTRSLLKQFTLDVIVALICCIWLIPWVIIYNEIGSMLWQATALLGRADSNISLWIETIILVTIMTTLLPTLLHFISVLAFILSKITRPIFQPITSLILARLYEDKRSVLTQIAIGLGAIAALIKTI